MNKNKIIIPLALLSIVLGLIVIFNPFKTTTTAPDTTNTKPIVFKENKSIELEPLFKENWGYEENSMNSIKEYAFPNGSSNPQYTLDIFNKEISNSTNYTIINSKFINAISDVKTIVNSNNSLKLDDVSELKLPFLTSADANNPKYLVKEINFLKPDKIELMKVILTKDGNESVLQPTLNIIGKVGNDYFLLTNYLRDINITAITENVKKVCEVSDTDCIKTKSDAQIDSQLTNEFIDNSVKAMIATMR